MERKDPLYFLVCEFGFFEIDFFFFFFKLGPFEVASSYSVGRSVYFTLPSGLPDAFCRKLKIK